MSFPLPYDIEFRKEVVGMWLDDVDDRLAEKRPADARISWQHAHDIYMDLPPGCGDMALEDRLVAQRVKIDNFSPITNADNL